MRRILRMSNGGVGLCKQAASATVAHRAD